MKILTSVNRKTKILVTPSAHTIILLLIFIISACNKVISINPPKNSITTIEVFSDSTDAAAAIAGIYSSVSYRNNGISFCNGAETIFGGLSSDELVNFNSSQYQEFYLNKLEPTEYDLDNSLWIDPYRYIYAANACLEGVRASGNLKNSVKNHFVGEAKFLRAIFYFYLVNYFGSVPYVNTTDWKSTDTTRQKGSDFVYQQIIADLKDAISLLPSDYTYSQGLRTRANAPAARALLARVYLYAKDWEHAKEEADSVIQDGQFSLSSNLNSVFSANSEESILQWQLNTSFGSGVSTKEGYAFIPSDSTLPPNYFLSEKLISAFETGDLRLSSWVGRSVYNGTAYYYPLKYKNGPSNQNLGGSPTEFYTVLRLAEQYLIRAEAKAQLNNDIAGATSDLNIIRNRAGLGSLTNLSQSSLLHAIAHERQIELFAEWGHRWFDLKRTGAIDSIMTVTTAIKNPSGSWQSYQQNYPIPATEITLNPFLKQNPGY